MFSPEAIPNSPSVETLPFRQISRNGLITSLLARCLLPLDIPDNKRAFINDHRGEGGSYHKGLYCFSGIASVCQTFDNNSELLMTIYVAA